MKHVMLHMYAAHMNSTQPSYDLSPASGQESRRQHSVRKCLKPQHLLDSLDASSHSGVLRNLQFSSWPTRQMKSCYQRTCECGWKQTIWHWNSCASASPFLNSVWEDLLLWHLVTRVTLDHFERNIEYIKAMQYSQISTVANQRARRWKKPRDVNPILAPLCRSVQTYDADLKDTCRCRIP